MQGSSRWQCTTTSRSLVYGDIGGDVSQVSFEAVLAEHLFLGLPEMLKLKTFNINSGFALYTHAKAT